MARLSDVVRNGSLTLYLVRHAYAGHADAAQWPDDAARPLTPKGRRTFRAAARGLRRIVPDVELVLSSGYSRAWATAEVLHDDTGWPEPRECTPLEAPQPVSRTLEALRERAEGSIALVGHEPHLSTLASVLCAGSEHGFRMQLKKGAVAVVRVDAEVGPGAGYLLWAAAPKILRELDSTSSGGR